MLTRAARFANVHTPRRATFDIERLALAPPRFLHTHVFRRQASFMGDNIVNFYAGQPPLNRLSFHRQSAEKVNGHLHDGSARFIAFKDFKPLMKTRETGQLRFLAFDEVETIVQKPYTGPPSEHVDNKDKARFYESARLPHTLNPVVFLGIDDRPSASSSSVPASSDPQTPKGVPYFAISADHTDWLPSGAEWGDARASASAMDPWSAGIFAVGRALVDWNSRNRFCAACGSPTYSLWAGWKRNCSTAIDGPQEGKEECFSLKGLHNFAYPRTDPVIIMGILNTSGDKILLGRQKSWPKGMYSCLAGFVEPGESFEDAVRREVMEEAGIEVGPVRYSSSQPWPYPANLMVGCFGRSKDDQKIRLDLDNELEDAQWFSREQIQGVIASPNGSNYTRLDYKQLDQQGKAEKETEAALAPSERKPGEGLTGGGAEGGLSRVPPPTAIAGNLLRLWASGGLDLVSKL